MKPSRKPPDVVRIEDATVTIASNVILGPVSLRVHAGESWAVLGPNGSGKSTLLDLAGGIRHPTTGAVEILGGRLGSVDVREHQGPDRVRRTPCGGGHPADPPRA